MTHALWVRCAMCEDFYCTLHRNHAFDCPCPSIDVFAEHGYDPYTMTAKQITDVFPFENMSVEDFPAQENPTKQENREENHG